MQSVSQHTADVSIHQDPDPKSGGPAEFNPLPFPPHRSSGFTPALFAGCSSPNSGLTGLDTCFRYLGRLLSFQASHFFEEGRNSEHAWSPSQLSPPRAQGSLRSAAGPQPGTPAAAGYSSIPVLAPAPELGAVTCGAGAPPPTTSLARVKERISTPGPPRGRHVR